MTKTCASILTLYNHSLRRDAVRCYALSNKVSPVARNGTSEKDCANTAFGRPACYARGNIRPEARDMALPGKSCGGYSDERRGVRGQD
ncbi:MAG: hypothetical protein R6U93_03705 [Dehalococcoidia bacterium]